MNRTVRTAVSALAVTGLAFGFGACSEAADKAADQVDKAVAESYEVTYEVTGTAVESIEYHAGDGTAMQPQVESDKKPALPWTRTVKLHGIMPPAVMPVSTEPADLTCKVVYQGKVIKEAKGEQAMSGGCVAVSPVFN
ncbi:MULTISPECIES: MmpS family transport accessory protein [unclassified Streptomyces]|uniref:MmpS family transport accessory protein n=1 Tax=unclassified Streptomyces TaxID=2593676 RepID=UPI0036FCBA93